MGATRPIAHRNIRTEHGRLDCLEAVTAGWYAHALPTPRRKPPRETQGTPAACLIRIASHPQGPEIMAPSGEQPSYALATAINYNPIKE